MRKTTEHSIVWPARKVWERYGVCRATLDRWMEQPDLGFPVPMVINHRRYWRPEALLTWEESRAARAAEKAA